MAATTAAAASPPSRNKLLAVSFLTDCAMLCFFLLRVVLMPAMFIWQAVSIYLLPCLNMYLWRLVWGCFSAVNGRLCRCIDLRYVDPKFPATSESVNKSHPKGHYFAWMRAHELAMSKGYVGTYLFNEGISAGDVCQGGLGDCWLVSTIAALAEYPGLIQRIFITKETSPFGRYVLRLFDISIPLETAAEEGRGAKKGKFVNVVVDDLLPCKCDGGYPRPLYLKMDESGEIWPLLIEKALAKWSGSYESLDGGHCAWALATLTGWDTDSYIKFGKEKTWTKCSLDPNLEDPRNPHKLSVHTSPGGFEDNDFFPMLLEFDRSDFIMCCATGSGNDTVEESSQGIVQGHAYTLIGAYEVGNIRILKLRNPWGKFEWTGEWSDEHSSWDEHPEVKKALDPTFEDDGIFHISYADFCKNYKKVDVCKREVSARTDLYLDVDEKEGCIGPTKSCCQGCGLFWTGEGCRKTCGRKISEEGELRRSWFLRPLSMIWKDWMEARERRRAELDSLKPSTQV
mmetsp:Transcript_3316/g.6299  ORF Transcript_3316/g.6299 Transcript_3316/m.6299 type:complete len:512 (+) Transcript_3316:58-1593(+)